LKGIRLNIADDATPRQATHERNEIRFAAACSQNSDKIYILYLGKNNDMQHYEILKKVMKPFGG
jgi:hypothetical protein